MRIERKIETRGISKSEKERWRDTERKSHTKETLKTEAERTYIQMPPPAIHTEKYREMLEQS